MKKVEKEKAVFLEAIKADRFDAATRKGFAAWLEDAGFDDEAVIQREWTAEKMRAAETYLAWYADECEIDIDELIRGAHEYLDNGDWLGIGVDTPDTATGGQEEFWGHFMVVTGRPVPEDRREDSFISCAC